MKKVIIFIYNKNKIIIFYILELCCSMCFYKNNHSGHKLIDINDEEELKKENISIEDSSKDLCDNKNKLEELKNKIENEIIKLDKLYDKVDKEVTKEYEIMH